MTKTSIISCLAAMVACLGAGAQTLSLTSPDGRNAANFYKNGKELTYL